MLTLNGFLNKIKNKQNNSQRYNAIVEDICTLYLHHFPSQEAFTSDELWDFLFTCRENHLDYHKKIWNYFSEPRYSTFFSIIYIALDDPPASWWKQCQTQDLNASTIQY